MSQSTNVANGRRDHAQASEPNEVERHADVQAGARCEGRHGLGRLEKNGDAMSKVRRAGEVDVRTDMATELILPAFSTPVFDNAQVYAALVEGKTTIYFDTNAWITLSDGATEEALRCREACLRAVNEGRAIFPLSTASVSELMEHPRSDRRESQSELMDRLSRGVCFKALQLVQRDESDAFYAERFLGVSAPPVATTMFTSMPDYLGEGRMVFPAGWTLGMYRTFMDFLKNGDQYRSLNWLATHIDADALQQRHREQLDRFVREMTASTERALAHFGRVNFATFLREERSSLFQRSVLPRLVARLRGETLAEGERAWRRNQALGTESFDQIFARLPSLEMTARLFAARSMNPTRRVKPQDFWDNEHAFLAPVYADVFVSLDGGLRHILRQCGGAVRARVVGTLGELEAVLAQSQAVKSNAGTLV